MPSIREGNSRESGFETGMGCGWPVIIGLLILAAVMIYLSRKGV